MYPAYFFVGAAVLTVTVVHDWLVNYLTLDLQIDEVSLK